MESILHPYLTSSTHPYWVAENWDDKKNTWESTCYDLKNAWSNYKNDWFKTWDVQQLLFWGLLPTSLLQVSQRMCLSQWFNWKSQCLIEKRKETMQFFTMCVCNFFWNNVVLYFNSHSQRFLLKWQCRPAKKLRNNQV